MTIGESLIIETLQACVDLEAWFLYNILKTFQPSICTGSWTHYRHICKDKKKQNHRPLHQKISIQRLLKKDVLNTLESSESIWGMRLEEWIMRMGLPVQLWAKMTKRRLKDTDRCKIRDGGRDVKMSSWCKRRWDQRIWLPVLAAFFFFWALPLLRLSESWMHCCPKRRASQSEDQSEETHGCLVCIHDWLARLHSSWGNWGDHATRCNFHLQLHSSLSE